MKVYEMSGLGCDNCIKLSGISCGIGELGRSSDYKLSYVERRLKQIEDAKPKLTRQQRDRLPGLSRDERKKEELKKTALVHKIMFEQFGTGQDQSGVSPTPGGAIEMLREHLTIPEPVRKVLAQTAVDTAYVVNKSSVLLDIYAPGAGVITGIAAAVVLKAAATDGVKPSKTATDIAKPMSIVVSVAEAAIVIAASTVGMGAVAKSSIAIKHKLDNLELPSIDDVAVVAASVADQNGQTPELSKSIVQVSQIVNTAKSPDQSTNNILDIVKKNDSIQPAIDFIKSDMVDKRSQACQVGDFKAVQKINEDLSIADKELIAPLSFLKQMQSIPSLPSQVTSTFQTLEKLNNIDESINRITKDTDQINPDKTVYSDLMKSIDVAHKNGVPNILIDKVIKDSNNENIIGRIDNLAYIVRDNKLVEIRI